MIQKLFINNQEIFYGRFNFYQPQKEKQNIRVIIVVKKNLVDKIVIDHRIDLVNYLYFILLKIQKLNL